MKAGKIIFAAGMIGVAAYYAVEYFARAGHGTYVPLFILFPFSILFGSIGKAPALAAALGQFPVYGVLFSWGLRRKKILKSLGGIFLVHVLAVVAAAAGILSGIVS